ncbi:MAG: hypothetical protein KUG77_08500 [Nannocystaceae bacterium]|nr:hypothetical protein [Nannocystaceae bacterium]
MPKLDEHARALLDVYATTVQPTAQGRLHNRARLRARLDAADDPPEAMESFGPRAAVSRPRWPVVVMAAAALAAIAVGLATRGSYIQRHSDPASQADDTVHDPSDEDVLVMPLPRGRAPAQRVPFEAEEESVAIEPLPRPSPSAAATPGRARPSVGQRKRTAPVKAPASLPREDRLAQEVALIARARAQLLDGRDTAALLTFRLHGRDFPNGVFAEERKAWTATLSCRANPSEGAGSAKAFLRAHPNSPHARRVRNTCFTTVTDAAPTEE